MRDKNSLYFALGSIVLCDLSRTTPLIPFHVPVLVERFFYYRDPSATAAIFSFTDSLDLQPEGLQLFMEVHFASQLFRQQMKSNTNFVSTMLGNAERDQFEDKVSEFQSNGSLEKVAHNIYVDKSV